MQIYGFHKTTLLDYPGHVAAVLFTGGCNFRCPFCQNGQLVTNPAGQREIPQEEIFKVLKKRRGILTGVCISGGEPTLQPDLAEFLIKIKALGYLIKLDTNGYRPDVIATLVRRGLIDYIAMDIKASPERYALVCNVPSLDIDRIRSSVSYIRSCGLPFEFRTTAVRQLHSRQDFYDIGRWLEGCDAYFLQSYRDSGAVLRPGLTAFTKDELSEFISILKVFIPKAGLRNVD